MDLTTLKQRFGIIGNNEALNEALEVAMRVAPTDLSVLITGESGVGKEVFPQIIHANSSRKHGNYIAVLSLKVRSIPNCSGMKRALLPALRRAAKGISRRPTEELFSSTKWPNCRIRRKCACCVSCRRVNISASARRRHRRPMSGS